MKMMTVSDDDHTRHTRPSMGTHLTKKRRQSLRACCGGRRFSRRRPPSVIAPPCLARRRRARSASCSPGSAATPTDGRSSRATTGRWPSCHRCGCGWPSSPTGSWAERAAGRGRSRSPGAHEAEARATRASAGSETWPSARTIARWWAPRRRSFPGSCLAASSS